MVSSTYILRDLSHIRVVINSVVHESGGESQAGPKVRAGIRILNRNRIRIRYRNQRSLQLSCDQNKEITSFPPGSLFMEPHESGAAKQQRSSSKLEMHQRRLVRGSFRFSVFCLLFFCCFLKSKPDFLFQLDSA